MAAESAPEPELARGQKAVLVPVAAGATVRELELGLAPALGREPDSVAVPVLGLVLVGRRARAQEKALPLEPTPALELV